MTAARHHALMIVAMLTTIVVVGGCGTRSVLDVGYQTTKPTRFAQTPPRRVAIHPVTDQRVDPSQVGSLSKNGQDLVTRRPVVDIVREPLAGEFRRIGHSLAAEHADVAVAAEVEEFWLDVVTGYKRSQYVGRVAVAITVIDQRRGERVLVRRYVGIARRVGDEDIERAGRAVLDTALARTMHDLATDPTVLAALAAAP